MTSTADVTAFSGSCEWTGVLSSSRTGWLELRRSMITASDVASVLNLDDSPPAYRRSALGVYAEKLAEPKPDPLDIPASVVAAMSTEQRKEHLRRIFNDARFWGSRLEQPILSTVAEYSGWEYREGGALFRSNRYPWLGATLDAEIRFPDCAWGICEGKTSIIRKGWDEDTGDLPGHIMVQAQAQLLVTGAPFVQVVALLQGCSFVQIEVEPHIEFHDVIVELTGDFMDRLKRFDPPPADWRDGHILDQLYPVEDGTIVDLPDNAHEWTRELLEVVTPELKRLKKRDQQLRNLLKQKLGHATYGILPTVVSDKSAWAWKVNKAGQRRLTALKRPPRGARLHGGNFTAVANDPITLALEQSREADDPALKPVRFGKRKRARG